MPLPGDVTFRRKGEYAPAAIENMDESTPYKPVALNFNQADATTIRNREVGRLTGADSPSIYDQSRHRSSGETRRVCIIVIIVCLIVFFLIVLPLAITYGTQSSEPSKSSANVIEPPNFSTAMLHGTTLIVILSNNTQPNWTFQDFVQELQRQTPRELAETGSYQFNRTFPDMIVQAFSIYSSLCSINNCTSVHIPFLELNGNLITATFFIDLVSNNDYSGSTNFSFDRSMLDEFAPSLKVLFSKAYPGYAIDHMTTDFDYFCSSTNLNCVNSNFTNSGRFVAFGVPAAVTVNESDWRHDDTVNSVIGNVTTTASVEGTTFSEES